MDYIEAHKHRFGVEPICRVLTEHEMPIAPSGYYAHKNRLASRRALRDAALEDIIEATFHDPGKGRGVYGVRKMWHQLRRDGVSTDGRAGSPLVARCTAERLIRRRGLRGARRGASVITTTADRQSERGDRPA